MLKKILILTTLAYFCNILNLRYEASYFTIPTHSHSSKQKFDLLLPRTKRTSKSLPLPRLTSCTYWFIHENHKITKTAVLWPMSLSVSFTIRKNLTNLEINCYWARCREHGMSDCTGVNYIDFYLKFIFKTSKCCDLHESVVWLSMKHLTVWNKIKLPWLGTEKVPCSQLLWWLPKFLHNHSEEEMCMN